MNNMIKKEMLPFKWCDGCSIRVLVKYISEYFMAGNYTEHNTSIISGIGCSGRIAGYFNLDTMHTTHGRAVPVAEGLKLSNPDLNVFVMSGDGDLLSIGLNHVISAARRNADIKIICMNNSVYAMTGGQRGPTFIKEKDSLTEAIDTYSVICKSFNRTYARITLESRRNFNEVLDQVLNTKGFSFIEVIFPCYEKDYKKHSCQTQGEVLKEFYKKYHFLGTKPVLEAGETGVIL